MIQFKSQVRTIAAYADLYMRRFVAAYMIVIDTFKHRNDEKRSIKEDIYESCGLVFVKHWNNHYKGLYDPNKKYKHGDVIKYIVGDGPYYVYYYDRLRPAQIIYDGGYME